MANPEESSPLLSQMDGDDKVAPAPAPVKPSPAAPAVAPAPAKGCAAEWTADGVPMGHVSVVGEPVARNRWDSGLFSCLGRNDEFCSSDLEGSFEAFTRSCGCCLQSMVGDEAKREQVEMACDFLTHYMCHPCALCQEGRELRRRLPHPGFNTRPVLVMMPPMEQTMGRSA